MYLRIDVPGQAMSQPATDVSVLDVDVMVNDPLARDEMYRLPGVPLTAWVVSRMTLVPVTAELLTVAVPAARLTVPYTAPGIGKVTVPDKPLMLCTYGPVNDGGFGAGIRLLMSADPAKLDGRYAVKVDTAPGTATLNWYAQLGGTRPVLSVVTSPGTEMVPAVDNDTGMGVAARTS